MLYHNATDNVVSFKIRSLCWSLMPGEECELDEFEALTLKARGTMVTAGSKGGAVVRPTARRAEGMPRTGLASMSKASMRMLAEEAGVDEEEDSEATEEVSKVLEE